MARSLGSMQAVHWNLLTGVWAPGNVFYVDSGGSDSASGLTPKTALLTINGAMDKCTASQGDVIQVMGNSPSSPNDTGTITMDVAGVTLRGLYGRGLLSDSGFGSDTQNVPVLTITANYCTVENLYLGVAAAGTTGGVVHVAGYGTTIRNCCFDTQRTTIKYGVYGAGDSPYLLVEDCVFGGATGAYDVACIYLNNATFGLLRRNYFRYYAGIGISLPAACHNLGILDNRFYMPADTDGSAITLADGTGNIVVNGNHAYFGTTDPNDPYRDLNGDDDSNAWGLNYKGVTATLAKMT